MGKKVGVPPWITDPTRDATEFKTRTVGFGLSLEDLPGGGVGLDFSDLLKPEAFHKPRKRHRKPRRAKPGERR